jgi:UDP-3-O-[3-hydroxymyristoyl] glucosamine N-acyltransferase
MKKIHHGNLTIKKDTVCDFEEIRGNLYIYSDAKLDALTTVWGNLYIYSNTTLDALTTVGGGLSIRSNAKLDAGNLTTVWGDLYIYSDAKLDALTTVWGDLYIYSDAKLDALTTVGGYLYIYSNTTLDAGNLTTVGGYLSIYSDATLDAGNLTTVGGYLSIYSNAKLDAGNLTTVGGYLSIYSNTTLDALTTVGGYLSIHSNAKLDALTTVGCDLSIYSNAKLDAGNLTTVGGYLYIYSNTTLDALTTVGGYLYIDSNAKLDAGNLKNKNAGSVATNICRAALTAAMALNGFIFEDGILARSISSKGGVSKVQIVGQTTISYIVQKDGHTAHGKTLAEARADLLLKIGDRDTSKYKGWTPETKASLEEMIVAYRTITGACGQGVSHFLSSKNYKGKLSVAFVIKETEGKYGHESFKGFFNQTKPNAREWLDERYKATSEADERAEKAEAEVERLKDNLASAIEIAEILGRPFVTDARSRQLHHKLDQLKATLNPDKK